MTPFFKTFYLDTRNSEEEIEAYINQIINSGYLIIKSHIGYTVARDTRCAHVALFCKKLSELDELVKKEDLKEVNSSQVVENGQ